LKSQKLNIPVQTVINYLSALSNAYYVHKVSRANVKGLKIFEVGEKYYMEIDFMAERQGKRGYFQVSYMLHDQHTIDREFGNLLAIADNFPKYVITMDEISAPSGIKGIEKIHLREFLTAFD
jgi:predicted AAA+ superfamily ATPase